MRVKVYYNLHKHLWSVLSMTPKGWRVFTHSDVLTLDNVTWKVSEAGRQRVIREKRKNVHAFAIGELATILTAVPDDSVTWHPVRYNPYEGPHFKIGNNPVTNSVQVRFEKNRNVLAR